MKKLFLGLIFVMVFFTGCEESNVIFAPFPETKLGKHFNNGGKLSCKNTNVNSDIYYIITNEEYRFQEEPTNRTDKFVASDLNRPLIPFRLDNCNIVN